MGCLLRAQVGTRQNCPDETRPPQLLMTSNRESVDCLQSVAGPSNRRAVSSVRRRRARPFPIRCGRDRGGAVLTKRERPRCRVDRDAVEQRYRRGGSSRGSPHRFATPARERQDEDENDHRRPPLGPRLPVHLARLRPALPRGRREGVTQLSTASRRSSTSDSQPSAKARNRPPNRGDFRATPAKNALRSVNPRTTSSSSR